MSHNAYAYTNRITVYPTGRECSPSILITARRGSNGRGGLSFTAHTLFRTIEDIAAYQGPVPCSDDPTVQSLAEMLEELAHYGNRGYWRLKAWVHYHSDTVRRASKSKKEQQSAEKSAGVAWLVEEGNRFRDLALCYFEVADRERARERKDRRKGLYCRIEI